MNELVLRTAIDMARPRYGEFTGDTASRLGRELAAVISRRFPGAVDVALLAKQIESDFIEWSCENGTFTYPTDAKGRPVQVRK